LSRAWRAVRRPRSRTMDTRNDERASKNSAPVKNPYEIEVFARCANFACCAHRPAKTPAQRRRNAAKPRPVSLLPRLKNFFHSGLASASTAVGFDPNRANQPPVIRPNEVRMRRRERRARRQAEPAARHRGKVFRARSRAAAARDPVGHRIRVRACS
jgi:hypothetical protein